MIREGIGVSFIRFGRDIEFWGGDGLICFVLLWFVKDFSFFIMVDIY